jgi:cytochrome c2
MIKIFLVLLLIVTSSYAAPKKIVILSGLGETRKLAYFAQQVFKEDFQIQAIQLNPKTNLQKLNEADLLILGANRLTARQRLSIKAYISLDKALIVLRPALQENLLETKITGSSSKGEISQSTASQISHSTKYQRTFISDIKSFRCESPLLTLAPLSSSTKVLLWGKAETLQPVAWTNSHRGKVFCTTLRTNLQDNNFQLLLYRAAYWATDLKAPRVMPHFKYFSGYLESHFPYFSTSLDARNIGPAFPAKNLTARGVVLKPGLNFHACFDTDLLRYALIWKGGGIELTSMAPGSYNLTSKNKKSAAGERALPKALGSPLLALATIPGVETKQSTWQDPREPASDPKQLCNGPLPLNKGHWNGIMLTKQGPVLSYSLGKTEIFETLKSSTTDKLNLLERRFKVVNAKENLFFHVGEFNNSEIATFKNFAFIKMSKKRVIALKVIGPNAASFSNEGSRIDLQVKAGSQVDLSLLIWEGPESQLQKFKNMEHTLSPFPDLNNTPPLFWPSTENSKVIPETTDKEFLIDRVELPLNNPDHRNIRLSGIDFFKNGTAALSTFDGDVWVVKGLDNKSTVSWKRFASGLHEPLGLVIKDEKIIVFDRNGLIRLHDRNNNGEADFYENLCNLPIQTAESREFAMDIKLMPDGSFVIAKGGLRSETLSPYAGAIIHISANGKKTEIIANSLREPFIGVDPKTGEIFASDQQGHWVPSTPFYVIKKNGSYGFKPTFIKDKSNTKLSEKPATWIPHRISQSGASILRLHSKNMGSLNNKIVYLDYTTATLSAIFYDSKRPQEAVCMQVKNKFTHPLLKGAINPKDGLLYLTGFQIWGSKAKEVSGLSRLRPGKQSTSLPSDIRIYKQGIKITFDQKIKAESINPHMVKIERWNYLRSHQYGSSHYTLTGKKGQERLGLSSLTLSHDQKSLFIAIPDMKIVMQMALSWRLLTTSDQSLNDSAYFSVNILNNFDPKKENFSKIDFKAKALATPVAANIKPSIERGRQVVEKMGCTACHSASADSAGKPGPPWQGIFGSEKELTNKTTITANDAYLRESILKPAAKIVKGYVDGMLPYEGILKEDEVQSIILYLKSLK